jgi:hypothetical protein
VTDGIFFVNRSVSERGRAFRRPILIASSSGVFRLFGLGKAFRRPVVSVFPRRQRLVLDYSKCYHMMAGLKRLYVGKLERRKSNDFMCQFHTFRSIRVTQEAKIEGSMGRSVRMDSDILLSTPASCDSLRVLTKTGEKCTPGHLPAYW